MARKRHSAEEIVNKLRPAEVDLSKGGSVVSVCTLHGDERNCFEPAESLDPARAGRPEGPLRMQTSRKNENLLPGPASFYD